MVNRTSNHALLFTVVVLLGIQCGNARAQKIDGDKLLDPMRLIEIRIELAEDDWQRLCRQSRNAGAVFSGLPSDNPYTYFKADLWIDGQEIRSVGIRKKGFFGSADGQRPSLKIKFDEYEKQKPVKGLSRLTLNNNKQDRSQASQYIVYQLFRDAGNAAPRSNWAHVVVNGSSLGIYSNVESIKKSFLARNFDDKTGDLYEGTLTDFHPKAIDRVEVKTNEDENDLGDIKRLAELLTGEGDLDLDELGKIIDLDSFLRHWTLESLTGFWDGYAANQNNYFVYFNPKNDGRGHFIPWGADWVLTNGGPFSFGNRGPTVIYAQAILTNRLYHTRGIPERYRATMASLLDGAWDEEKMLADIDLIEQLVSPHLHRTQAGTPQALNEVREFIRGRRAVIERALEDWQPNVPPEPRAPAHLVDVGKASGMFSTSFTDTRSEQSGNSDKVDISVQLDDKVLEFEELSVRIQAIQPRTFGGGFGGAAGRAQNSTPSVSVILNGSHSGSQPISLSLTVDRDAFENASDDPIDVTGSLQEGQRSRSGFGFGGGARRMAIGEIKFDKTGTDVGASVAGTLNVKIVETRGGMFAGNRGFGGGTRRTPDPNAEKRRKRVTKGVSLFKQLDANEDGELSKSEWSQAPQPLAGADANRDAVISLRELFEWLKKE